MEEEVKTSLTCPTENLASGGVTSERPQDFASGMLRRRLCARDSDGFPLRATRCEYACPLAGDLQVNKADMSWQ
jgi:hypothetical protein